MSRFERLVRALVPGRLRTRVALGLALCAVALLGVALAVADGARRFIANAADVERDYRVLDAVERTYSFVKDAESAQRGLLLTGEEQYERAFQAGAWAARAALREVREVVAPYPDQVVRAERLESLVFARLEAAEAVAQQYRREGFAAAQAALASSRGPTLMAEIESLRDEMAGVARDSLHERAVRSGDDAFSLQAYTAAGVAASLAIMVVLAVRMLRAMAERGRAERRTCEAHDALEQTVREIAQRGAETRALSDYAGMLQSCRDVPEAVTVTRDAILRIAPDVGTTIYVTRASLDFAEVLADFGDHRAVSAIAFPPQDCWAIRRAQPHAMSDVSMPLRCGHVSAPADGVVAASLCVPLAAQGLVLGAAFFSGEPAALAARRDLLVAATEQLGLALSNLQLQETLRQQTIRDPLTNLYNRRYLEASLERELARCERRGVPLSVLMIDLDHFKRFNDAHGHDGGDALLQHAARALQAQCRAEDIACRYGGEELTLILPEAPAEVAFERAESVRRAIESLQVRVGQRTLGEVTASIGVATFPASAPDTAGLLRAADAALYRAKREGRNRVEADRLLHAS